MEPVPGKFLRQFVERHQVRQRPFREYPHSSWDFAAQTHRGSHSWRILLYHDDETLGRQARQRRERLPKIHMFQHQDQNDRAEPRLKTGIFHIVEGRLEIQPLPQAREQS
jgi:hypothetical protein